jgi:hypothetical protein
MVYESEGQSNRRKMIRQRQRDELNISAIRGDGTARSVDRRSGAGDGKSHNLAECSFDYSSIDPSVAKFLRGQAERIRRQCLTTVVQIGNALVQAKRYLSHGNFLIWVECEVGITARTAQLYMRAALWSSNKAKVVSGFPPSLVYLLSAPTTPADFADRIVERAAAGIPIGLANIRRELKELSESAEKQSDRNPSGHATVPLRKASRSRSNENAWDAVTQVIAILARDLPKEQFASVRNVLTTQIAIDDSELATIVANAFSAIPE